MATGTVSGYRLQMSLGRVTAEALFNTEWRRVTAGTTHCGSKMAFPLLSVTANPTVMP